MPHKPQPNPTSRNSPQIPEREPKWRKTKFSKKIENSRNGAPTSGGHNFFRLCPICLKIHQSTHLDELRRLAKESAPGDANLARNGRISIRPAPPLRSGRNFRSFFGAKISAGAATSRSAATRSCANTPPSNRRCNIAAGRGLKNAGHLDFENELRKNPGRESLHPEVRATACPSPSFKMSLFKWRSPKMGSRLF